MSKLHSGLLTCYWCSLLTVWWSWQALSCTFRQQFSNGSCWRRLEDTWRILWQQWSMST